MIVTNKCRLKHPAKINLLKDNIRHQNIPQVLKRIYTFRSDTLTNIIANLYTLQNKLIGKHYIIMRASKTKNFCKMLQKTKLNNKAIFKFLQKLRQ